MPLRGGPADKLGNRYEVWWTLLSLIRILEEVADSIRIEVPGLTKAEFIVKIGAIRELHQTKRSHSNGKWKLADLADVLQAMHTELSGNSDLFFFVSGSDAPELRELSERARDAASVEEFETQFLEADIHQKNFSELIGIWKNIPRENAYDILKRIHVQTTDELILRELVRARLSCLFLGSVDSVVSELRAVANDAVHKTLTREILLERLAKCGHQLRRLPNPAAAGPLIVKVTNQYLATAKKKLIQNHLIPRDATTTLIDRIVSARSGSDSVLTGKAGSGKTAVTMGLVEGLRERKIPVLAFRLDRLKPVSNSEQLGEQLELEESPVSVLAAAAINGEAVLVLEQLDAVSTASGRSAYFLDAVEELLKEVRAFRARVKLHLVVVCREFDWVSDPRLRKMLPDQSVKVEVTEFSHEALRAALSTAGFKVELFQPRQLELLRLPQNLSLFLDAKFDPAAWPVFNTAKDLFDYYWTTKRKAVAHRAAPYHDQWKEVIDLLCDEINCTQQLFVPKEKLDQFNSEYFEQMVSEGVLVSDAQGRRFGFGHESFFDYCFARSFCSKDASLVSVLTASEQHLFRRGQVRQILTYLRDLSPERYCTQLHEIFSEPAVRVHIKDLAAAIVTSFEDPSDSEWDVLWPWLNIVLTSMASGQQCSDQIALLFWQHFFRSPSWFRLADQRGLVESWLAAKSAGVVTMAVNYIRLHERHSSDRVAELLEPYVGAGGPWQQRLRSIVEVANPAGNRRFFELFLRLIDDGTLDELEASASSHDSFGFALHRVGRTQPEWLAEAIAHWLKRRLVIVQQTNSEDERVTAPNFFRRHHGRTQHFIQSAEKTPALHVKFLLPVLFEIVDAALIERRTERPRRDRIWLYLSVSKHELIQDACLSSMATALRKIARESPVSLAEAIAELRKRDSYVANFLLSRLYEANAAFFADEAATLLSGEPWRFDCGYSGSPHWVARQLIKAIVPSCSPEQRVNLEAAILEYTEDFERSAPGHEYAGSACYNLLSSVPYDYRSKKARIRFEELEQKFVKLEEAPKEIRAYSFVSPIPPAEANKMTDEQWLQSVAKYDSTERGYSSEVPEMGGAVELAGVLRESICRDPIRFAQLGLRFSSGTNPVYLSRVLDGLKGAEAPTELKLDVCRKAFADSHEHYGSELADLLGSIKETLPPPCL